MKPHRPGYSPFLVLLTAFLFLGGLPSSVSAQSEADPIGKVIIAAGKFVARGSDGTERRLRRRSPIFEEETLVTGAKARAQIRFTDGSLLALEPESSFRIKNYQYKKGTDQDENAVYKLLKGGMRTITGAIGTRDKEDYEVETDVATIGIRGTHYVLQMCQSGCGDNQAKGLFGGVVNGRLRVDNDAGGNEFGADQYFQVSDSGSQPERLLAPPEFLTRNIPEDAGDEDGEDAGDDEVADEGSDGEAAGDDETTDEGTTGSDDGETTTDGDLDSDTEDFGGTVSDDTTTDSTIDTTDTTLDTTYQSTEDVDSGGNVSLTDIYEFPLGSAVGFGFVSKDPNEGWRGNGGIIWADGTNTLQAKTIDGIANVPVAATVYFEPHPDDPNDTGCDPCSFGWGAATLNKADAGGDETLGVNWGRWDGDFTIVENGVESETSGSFHYIYSPNITPLTALQARSGTVTYSDFGGTSPTDETGTAGTLDNASLSVNFTDQTITAATLDVSGVGRGTYVLDMGNANQSAVPLSDLYSTSGNPSGIEMANSAGDARAHMGVTFVGPNGEGAIGSYGIDDETNNHGITGTVFFKEGGT